MRNTFCCFRPGRIRWSPIYGFSRFCNVDNFLQESSRWLIDSITSGSLPGETSGIMASFHDAMMQSVLNLSENFRQQNSIWKENRKFQFKQKYSKSLFLVAVRGKPLVRKKAWYKVIHKGKLEGRKHAWVGLMGAGAEVLSGIWIWVKCWRIFENKFMLSWSRSWKFVNFIR